MPLPFLIFAFFISFAVVAILALATITLLVLLENSFCNDRVNFLESNEIPLGTIIDPGIFFSS